MAEQSATSVAFRERVLDELVACYGEAEDTDWPYLNDLADLIVNLCEQEFQERARFAGSETGPEVERPAVYCDYCGWREADAHMGTCPHG